jgi:DNA-binding IclR family transcriptional regulator
MSKIAEAVGFKVSEIQRMVEFLTQDGFLVKTASGAYAPGARAYGMADRKLDSAIIARAEGPMRRYSARTGASVHLGLLVEDRLHVVYEVEGTGDVRVGVRPGLYVAEKSPSGRLLAAYRSLATSRPGDAAGHAAAGAEAILRDRYSFGELACAIGVYVVAVPIAVGADPCVATLASPYVLRDRGEPLVRADFVDELRRASAEISALF